MATRQSAKNINPAKNISGMPQVEAYVNLLDQANKNLDEQIEKLQNVSSQFDFLKDILDTTIILQENVIDHLNTEEEITQALREQEEKIRDLLKLRERETILLNDYQLAQNKANSRLNEARDIAREYMKSASAAFSPKIFAPYVNMLQKVNLTFGEQRKMFRKTISDIEQDLLERGKDVELGALRWENSWSKMIFSSIESIVGFAYEKLKNMLLPILGILKDAALDLFNAFLKIPGALFSISIEIGKLSKMSFEFIGSFIKAVIAIPLNILEKANDLGYEIKKEFTEFAQTFENLQKDFRGGEFIGTFFSSLQQNLIGARKEFMDVNSEAVNLFGRGIAGINKAFQETQELVKSLGNYSSIFAEQITKNKQNAFFYAKMKKSFDLTDEDLKYITMQATNSAKSIATVYEELRSSIVDSARTHHQDAKQMSRDYLDMRKNIISFGHIGDRELGGVVGRIRQMRVELKDAVSVFEKIQTFEDAANMASQLSQSFNMVIDSMDLLRAESPDQVLKMLREAMFATGRSFNQLNRFEKSLLQQQTGLSAEAMSALFSFENMGKSYKEIMDEQAKRDPVQQQIAALNSMKDAIVELKEVMPKFQNSFDAFFTGLKDNVLISSSVLRKELESVSFSFDDIYREGLNLKLSKTMEQALLNIVDIIKQIRGVLTSPGFLTTIITITDSLSDMIRIFTQDFNKTMVPGTTYNITKQLTAIMTAISPIFKSLFAFGFEFIKAGIKMFSDSLPDIVSGVITQLQTIFTAPSSSSSLFSSLISQVLTAINTVGVYLSSPAGQAAITSVFKGIFSIASSIFTIIFTQVQNLFVTILTDIAAPGGKSASKILRFIEKTFNSIFDSVFGKISATTGKRGGGFLKNFFGFDAQGNLNKSVKDGFVQAVKNIGNTILPIMKTIAREATEMFIVIVDELMLLLDQAISGGDSFFDSLFKDDDTKRIFTNLNYLLNKVFLDTQDSIVKKLIDLADNFFAYLNKKGITNFDSIQSFFAKIIGASLKYYYDIYGGLFRNVVAENWKPILAGILSVAAYILVKMKIGSMVIKKAIIEAANYHASVISGAITSNTGQNGTPIPSPSDNSKNKFLKKAGIIGTVMTVAGMGLDYFGPQGNPWVEGASTALEIGGSTLAGASTGAYLGSMIAPGYGTVIGGALGGLAGLISSVAASDFVRDGYISKDGKVTKIHDNDNVMAFKEGGPVIGAISNLSISSKQEIGMLKNISDGINKMSNSTGSSIKPEDIKAAVKEAIIEGFKSQNQVIEVKLNGEKVGEGLLASGFVNMMTNANKSKGAPTLNPNTLTYRDGQIPTSGYNARI